MMGKITAEFTMSLDGFIAAPNDDVRPIFGWYSSGDTALKVPNSDMVFMVSKASADLLQDSWSRMGAIVTGRGDFDASAAWGGIPPYGVPIFIVTHSPPPAWDKPGSPFTFVTEGVELALEQAKQAAGDKNVVVGGSKIIQQCIKAGLLEEIQINLVPILLGEGIRLFDNLGTELIELGTPRVIATPAVTHLIYSIPKRVRHGRANTRIQEAT